jgi:alpha-L-rhamnosidase
MIHQHFFNPDQNTYANGEQPYLAFPLLVDVVPKEFRAKVMDNLEHDILVKRKGHLNSGMHGTYFMLNLLMQEARNDLIFEMTSKKTYPGWGYMLEQGATTIWESWTGNSHIHDTLISIGSWFIKGIGGIRIDENSPGFKHFFIKPQTVGDLTWAKTTYNSIYGKIVSDWRFKNAVMKLNVTIPANTTATVYVPAKSENNVTESGKPASTSTGVTFLRMEDGSAVFNVNSGNYSFVVK